MIEFRTLKENELEAWFDHCATVFTGASRQYFKNHWINDPWRDLNTIFIALDNNRIISTIRVFKRRLYLCGEAVTMGGIGEVSTLKDYRKQGLSSTLLNMALEYMKNSNIKISMLFGNEPLYFKNGYELIKSFSTTAKVDKYKNLYNIEEFNPNEHLEDIKSLYDTFNSKHNGAIIRDDDFYWDNWFTTEVKNCFVAKNKTGDVIAYMSVILEDNIIVVSDFASEEGYENIFEELSSFIYIKLKHILNINHIIKCTSSIETSLVSINIEPDENNMIKLISPFKIGDHLVKTTKDLLTILDSNFLFSNIDGF